MTPLDAVPLADPLTLPELAGRAVAVWGAGREGLAAVSAATQVGASVTAVVVDEVTDAARAAVEAAAPGLPLLGGAAGGAALLSAEVVVKSPGISPYRDDARALRAAGVLRTGGTALTLATTAGQEVVGVTGSKGKSTTASLIAHLLEGLGRPVVLGGNIGVAPLEVLGTRLPGITTVLELSSFQSAEVRHSPEVGVFTSFFPDHLDWHGSVERYRADKSNLFRHGPRAVVADALDPAVADALAGVPQVVHHGLPGGVHVGPDGTVLRGRTELFPLAASPLPGRHNAANLCAALTVLDVLGLDLTDARLPEALSRFRPLAHRLERVASAAGLEWYDDGLATTPQAAIAAVEVFGARPVCLLLGGRDRGLDYAPLAAHLVARPAPTVALLLPDNGGRIAAAISAAGPPAGPLVVERAPDLAAAVRRAAELTPDGGAVLLSPAAPSFGHFADYRDRGRAFVAAVRALG
ncbi:MAG: UDP-N-acetylmuramoyl-L-alanine--D-glutamate ligase [Mycobacterium sp.]|jgi:UDP-N-acetylmuramoylalanine--D-glutamate ligase|nr:UDP-N-acetylmuramoyl-L-alanine--D-glutamate ligase [Mycobacterium sp.]